MNSQIPTIDQNIVVLTLEYSYLLQPQAGLLSIFHQSTRKSASLWREFSPDKSKNAGFVSHLQQSGLRVMDNIEPLRSIVDRINSSNLGEVTLLEPKLSTDLISVVLKGSAYFVNYARSKVLKEYNQVMQKSISLSNFEFQKISQSPMKVTFFQTLDKIAERYNIEYIISHKPINFKIIGYRDDQSTAPNFNIYLLGGQDNITAAESQVRILMNTILNDFYVDTYKVNLSALPLIGGVDLFNFNQIAKQSESNIYVPDLLPELFHSKLFQSNAQLDVFITTKSIPGIIHAKQLLGKLNSLLSDNGSYIVKEMTMSKSKLDLITLMDQSTILNIMFKHGVFIQLPSLGEEQNFTISVQGQTLTSVNETIRELSLLSSKYYSVNINFDQFSIACSEQFESLLCNIVNNEKPCILISNENGIEIIGLKEEVRTILMLLDTNFMRHYPAYTEIKLNLELNHSQRDFISGKKNGKMMKVLNQLNQIPVIEFLPFNEFNFLLCLTVASNQEVSNIVQLFLKGLDLIELELPAELNFNIPEVFHKSIIGNGGSIIQSIMKKYNVFIKFTSSTASGDRCNYYNSNKIFYTFSRFDNVLIKCPNKNAKSIPLVKYEIDELVYQCCAKNIMSHSFSNSTSMSTTYLTTHFKLLRSQYLMLINSEEKNGNLSNHLKMINNIESETNTFIDFPNSLEDFGESDEIVFQIKGADIKSRQAAIKFSEYLPKMYRIMIAYNPGKFDDIISTNSEDFNNNIIYPFKMLLGIEMTLLNEGSSPLENPSYHSILLNYNQIEKLNTAVEELTTFLRQKNFLIMDKGEYVYDGIVDSPKVTNSSSNNIITKKLKPITNINTPACKGKKKYQRKSRDLRTKAVAI
ncbi:hypothetical protein CAAN1_02S06348 [[Candida] anglica]|uniref:K Homology domain-containing protein n=1 Tax=[Candida] anglica TaxID=148631 RepID=A0ABP0EC53_9ASCO